MNEILKFIISALLLIIGIASFAIGVFGIYRFKFVLNRMHAAAILDTMGLFFVIAGLAVARGFDAISGKMVLVFVILWITSPISSHLLAKTEYVTDKNIKDEVPVLDKENDNGSDGI